MKDIKRGQSEAGNRIRIDFIMAKTKITNGQAMIYKNSEISHIWKVCRSFSFLYNLDAFFSLNWLRRELSVVCRHISSISYVPEMNRIPKFRLSYFWSNFYACFCKMTIFMGYWWTKKMLLFYFKKESKDGPNSEFRTFGRHI